MKSFNFNFFNNNLNEAQLYFDNNGYIIIDNILKVGLMGTRGSKHEIRIKSSKFTPINTISVNLPKTTDDEVVDIYRGKNRDWADDIFGDWSGRIRTDFVDYFYDNRERICKSIKDYDEYNTKGYSND